MSSWTLRHQSRALQNMDRPWTAAYLARCRRRHPACSDYRIQVLAAAEFRSRHANQDLDMRDIMECKTTDELYQYAQDHLDVVTPRGKSAKMWAILPKLLQKHGGGPSRTNFWYVHIKEQLDTILCNTLEDMRAFDSRDIANCPQPGKKCRANWSFLWNETSYRKSTSNSA